MNKAAITAAIAKVISATMLFERLVMESVTRK